MYSVSTRSIRRASRVSPTRNADPLTRPRTPTNPDGSAKFADPDQQVQNLTSPSTNGSTPGTKTFRSGNTTFSFGVTGNDGPWLWSVVELLK